MGLPAVKEIVQAEVTKIFTELGIDRRYIFTEAKQMYDNLKAIEDERDTEKNPSMALTEILNIRFRLLKFFQQSLEEGAPAKVEGSIVEKQTFALSPEQSEAHRRGEKINASPTEHSIEVRRTIKGEIPAMPGAKDVSTNDGSGGDSGRGSA